MFEGKRVFVTGGSGAIGRALAVRFASRGAEVAFSYLSNHEEAEKTGAAIREASGKEPRVLRANLKDAEECASLARELLEGWPAVDLFVSNAASGVLKSTLELSPKHWDWTVGINARAFLILANAVIPKMPRGGRILALSSAGATKAIPLYAAIGASKAALESLVRSLAVETGPLGITVNAIAPGIVESGALEHFPHREQLLELALKKTSMGRLCTPEDVADLAEFLAGPKAGMINGQTIHVDGGYNVLA